MSKFDTVRGALKGRPSRILAVVAITGALIVGTVVVATSQTVTETNQTLSVLDAPCAIFDTRAWDIDGSAGPRPVGDIPAKFEELDFYIADAVGDDQSDRDHFFGDQLETTETVEPNQGARQAPDTASWHPDGCNVPNGADTVFLLIEAVNPTGNGNLQAYVPGATPGGVLIYDGSVFGQSNSTILDIAVADGATSPDPSHLHVKLNGNPVHVRGSVIGYGCEAGAC